jgi:hypothetical protein
MSSKKNNAFMSMFFWPKPVPLYSVDMPGTGEGPVSGREDGERIYSTIISYIRKSGLIWVAPVLDTWG